MRDKIDDNIIETLQYFHYFRYPVSLDQIHLFHPKKIGKKTLSSRLHSLEKGKKIIKYYYDGLDRYTIGEYSIKHKSELKRRWNYSIKKREKIQPFISRLLGFSMFQLIGISGSCAMHNAKKDDDIDLFIISDKRRMYTSRFIGLFLATLMGLKRKRNVAYAKDKVCLNLFFDLKNLRIPAHKRTLYVAHEIIQMQPIIVKNDIYKRFLQANAWVFDYFPNAKKIIERRTSHVQDSPFPVVGDVIEFILKHFQLFLIRRHRTNEYITDTQLWFFPDDFEKKITFSRPIRQK